MVVFSPQSVLVNPYPLYMGTSEAYDEKAMDIAKQLMAECKDSFITLGAMEDLAKLKMVCEDERQCFFELEDYENALYSFEEVAVLLDYFWRSPIPREYTLLQSRNIPGGFVCVRLYMLK